MAATGNGVTRDRHAHGSGRSDGAPALPEQRPEGGLVLEVRDLRTAFVGERGPIKAVDGVSLHVARGEVLAVVGESGSGKSVTALSVMGLLSRGNSRVLGGSVKLLGDEVLGAPEAQLRRLRGARMAMIFQDPIAALNPVFTVGNQIVEAIRLHLGMSRGRAHDRAVAMLAEVGITNPTLRMRQYPHELSGGMCQRVMIAIALACEARLLIADEPTTGLDVTVQAQILDLFRQIKQRQDVGILLITHDMGVVADLADRVAVYYAGEVVEESPVEEFFARPRHPYSAGLMACIPDPWERVTRMRDIPGTVPRLDSLPIGCRFSTRCEFASERCRQEHPSLLECAPQRTARCHYAQTLDLTGTTA